QSPSDVPDAVLAQLGNRVQHALRAYTPSDQKAVKAAAQSFRANPGVDVAKEIQELVVGEALVSTLDAGGAPTPVARTKVRPPNSQVGALLLATRQQLIAASPFEKAYRTPINRESAYEVLSRKAEEFEKAEAKEAERAAKEAERNRAARAPAKSTSRRSSSRTSAVERAGTRVATNVFSTIAREIVRGIIGTPRRRR
ncbi:MAG: helicase HerA-like domain-containing protein, partial [Caulobacterales bacterium]